jgi:hypothetical protein
MGDDVAIRVPREPDGEALRQARLAELAQSHHRGRVEREVATAALGLR